MDDNILKKRNLRDNLEHFDEKLNEVIAAGHAIVDRNLLIDPYGTDEFDGLGERSMFLRNLKIIGTDIEISSLDEKDLVSHLRAAIADVSSRCTVYLMARGWPVAGRYGL